VGRWVAIDFGAARCGIAVTDVEHKMGFPLETIETKNLLNYISAYHLKESIERLIIGEPKQKDGNHSTIEPQILNWIAKFQNLFPDIRIIRVDERYTSKLAAHTLAISGLKQKKHKEKLDQIAAAILLQTYLDSSPL
jgi:putative holliday junction resolvase